MIFGFSTANADQDSNETGESLDECANDTKANMTSSCVNLFEEAFRDLGKFITALVDEWHVGNSIFSFCELCLLTHNDESNDEEHDKLGT